MNIAAVRNRLGLGVAATLVAAALALPLLAPGLLGGALMLVNALVAVTATLTIATMLARSNDQWARDTAAVFAASLLLAGSATIVDAPQTNVTWLAVALASSVMYAVTTRLAALVPVGLARTLLAVAVTSWVWSSTPVADAGSTVLGVIALAAPGITLHAITSNQRRALLAAVVAWPAAVLFVARIAAHAEAVHKSELVARDTLKGIPAFVTNSSIPVIEGVNMLPKLALAAAAAAVALLAIAAARFGAPERETRTRSASPPSCSPR